MQLYFSAWGKPQELLTRYEDSQYLGLPFANGRTSKDQSSEVTPLMGSLAEVRGRRALLAARQIVLFSFMLVVTIFACVTLAEHTWWSVSMAGHVHVANKTTMVQPPTGQLPDPVLAYDGHVHVKNKTNMVKPPTSQFPDPLLAYNLQRKVNGTDYANCEGLYIMAQGPDYELNGKPYYVNTENGRFIAWSGSVWEITGLVYLTEIKKHHSMHGFWPGSFGGFHASSSQDAMPDRVSWQQYIVNSEHITPARRAAMPIDAQVTNAVIVSGVTAADSSWAIRFTTRPGSSDYGNCQGLYVNSGPDNEDADSELNNKPYYVREDGQMFLAWNSRQWVISATSYLERLKRDYEGSGHQLQLFGGYHFGGGARPELGEWSGYEVSREKMLPRVDQTTGFRFTVKEGKVDAGSCQGFYWPIHGDSNWLNGKQYYLNHKGERFMVWNNMTGGNSGGIWEIIPMPYLTQLQQHFQKHLAWLLPELSFVGLATGGGQTPDAGAWANYDVSPVQSKHRSSFKFYHFTAKPVGKNYASCDGIYTMADGHDFELNGKPYFVCSMKNRFLAWSGDSWEITSTQYLEGIKKHHKKHGFWPGSFGGYHQGGGDWPDDGSWASYDVSGEEPIAISDELS